jgi:hypothetical protein
MPYDAPYHVVEYRRSEGSMHVEYAICRSGEGTLVTGSDLVFMHKIIDLLNEEVRGSDVHR